MGSEEAQRKLANELIKVSNPIAVRNGAREAAGIVFDILADSLCIYPIKEKVRQEQCAPHVEAVQKWAKFWVEELHGTAIPAGNFIDPLGEYYVQIGATDKKYFAQFFTPNNLVRMMCEVMIDKGKEETVLDPCCGSGRFGLQTLVLNPQALSFNADRDITVFRMSLINFQAHFLNKCFWRVMRCDSLMTELVPSSPNWLSANRWIPPGQEDLILSHKISEKQITMKELEVDEPVKALKVKEKVQKAQKECDETGVVQMGLFDEELKR